LYGSACSAVFFALAMISHKQTAVETMKALVHDAPVLFLASLLAMAAGLAIILAHNVWSGGALPVVVTVVGWILLIKGLIFLLLPSESSVAYSEALRYSQLFFAYMSIALLFGVFVTLASCRSLGRTPEPTRGLTTVQWAVSS
jgi:uncharacterized membrane protein